MREFLAILYVLLTEDVALSGLEIRNMFLVRAFWRDETAATSIEYAVIGSLISIMIVAGATAIGTKLNAKIAPISTNLN